MDPANGFWEDHADVHSLDFRALEFLYFVGNRVCNNHLQKEKNLESLNSFTLSTSHIRTAKGNVCPPDPRKPPLLITEQDFTLLSGSKSSEELCIAILRIHGYYWQYPSLLSFWHLRSEEGTKISPTLKGKVCLHRQSVISLLSLVFHCCSLGIF